MQTGNLPSQRQIVFILSTPYAGSHFLSLQLGSHSRALHIGEIVNLGSAKSQNWHDNELSAKLLDGLGRDDRARIHSAIFERCDPGVNLLVDTSKKVFWAQACLPDNRFGKKYLHLIRDPRALVRRYGLASTFKARCKMRCKVARRFPALAFSVWGARETDLWTYQWLLENQKITRFIREHRLDAELITYRDLALDPSTELMRITRWLGLDFEPGQLDYWNKTHIGSLRHSYDWVKEKKTQHFDVRWQTELPPETRKHITENPRVLQYLDDLKIQFAPDGLVRTGAAYG
ncbi:MAG TPA: hypothetical protein VK742_20665 [Candidatus Sulfotelmatobacter sp.]|jgi:hypothetical protein|nr:hypothetical protein [Candidatus Sulfotelmatobacter sp.]